MFSLPVTDPSRYFGLSVSLALAVEFLFDYRPANQQGRSFRLLLHNYQPVQLKSGEDELICET
jgi:hypothetical protein